MKRLSKRKPNSHKGENGKVLIIAGSEEYVGAPILSGLAAFRTGVDLVYFAAPEKVAYVINTYKPDFITKKLKRAYLVKQHVKQIMPLVNKVDVVVIGPGLGTTLSTRKAVLELVKKIKKVLISELGE